MIFKNEVNIADVVNSMLATCAAIIAVAGLMIAATLSVGIAFAQPVQPPGPPFSTQPLQVRTVQGNIATVPAGDLGSSSAFCAPGESVTGGGYLVQSEFKVNSELTTIVNPINPNPGWEITGVNTGASPTTINAFAMCASFGRAP